MPKADEQTVADPMNPGSAASFQGKAETASAIFQAAQSALETYYAEHNTYTGMTLNALWSIDPQIALSADPVILLGGAGFCIETTIGTSRFRYNGPGSTGTTSPGTC